MKHIYSYMKTGFKLMIALFILTGCMFQKEKLAKNQVPHEDQIEQVQNAIEKYQEQTGGLLPIKTKPNETPIYEKYIIQFKQLEDENVLSNIPGNSFENGGIYQYVLIDVEENPTVKLIDLRTTSEVQKLHSKVNTYRNKHIYTPYGENVGGDLHTLDYEKLGLTSEPTVVSPFTQNNLPFVIDMNGDIYIDYRYDLTSVIEETDSSITEGEDIRHILTDDSPFVPAHSLPYTIEDGEPVFLIE